MDDSMPPLLADASFRNEFDGLYDKYYAERFQHALPSLTRALTTLLDHKLPASQRLRVRVEQGRIKSRNRLLLKAETDKYRPLIQTPDEVFVAVRDIVGTRVTCNTLSDVYAVCDVIESCATSIESARTLSKLHDDWKDDYIKDPKESGYRAINLIVGVPVPYAVLMQLVTCEIQIRTLLQHGWGELTHEDTYKPGVKVPELVRVLSKRLATTLAVLDEIAQDLRDELDKVEGSQAPTRAPMETAPTTEQETGERQPSIEKKPVLEALPAAPTSHGESSAPIPVEQTERLSKEDLSNAFQAAFGRALSIGEDVMEEVLEELETARVTRMEQLITGFTDYREMIEGLESEYEKVKLTDLGRLRATIHFSQDAENGTTWVRTVLKDAVQVAAAKATTKESFKSTYPEGREALGSVVFVTGDYALVQLPEGDTGILHATQMKTSPYEYVTVSELVREGDTVRVRILKTNPETKRIELQFIR